MEDDPRVAAARYQVERLRRTAHEAGTDADEPLSDDAVRAAATARTPTAADRTAVVETAIQQAIRRGDFDDLPGSGKPLALGSTHDPDWWITRKIHAEQLRGLGPPALTLRVEHAELEARLDELARETDVREHLEDFNRRVIEARRQLLGGPPVITPTRDVDADAQAWRERREARLRAEIEAAAAAADAAAPRRRRFRFLGAR